MCFPRGRTVCCATDLLMESWLRASLSPAQGSSWVRRRRGRRRGVIVGAEEEEERGLPGCGGGGEGGEVVFMGVEEKRVHTPPKGAGPNKNRGILCTP